MSGIGKGGGWKVLARKIFNTKSKFAKIQNTFFSINFKDDGVKMYLQMQGVENLLTEAFQQSKLLLIRQIAASGKKNREFSFQCNSISKH